MKIYSLKYLKMVQKIQVSLMFVSLVLCSILLPRHVLAGGDFSAFKVTSYSESNGVYRLGFEEKQNSSQLIGRCKSFEVRVIYKRVPWYSWLPFIHTSHPTSDETEKALKYIYDAYVDKKDIYFGYMGNGLVSTDSNCVFDSSGLKLDGMIILSYYGYV